MQRVVPAYVSTKGMAVLVVVQQEFLVHVAETIVDTVLPDQEAHKMRAVQANQHKLQQHSV